MALKKTKKKSSAKIIKTVAKRVSENPKVKSAMGSVMTVGVPAGISLVGSRLIAMLATKLAKGDGTSEARWRQALAPHAATIVSLFIFLGLWYGTSKSKYLQKYKTGLLVGAGLATVITVAQSYFFKNKQLPAGSQTQQIPSYAATPENEDYEYTEESQESEEPSVMNGLSDAELDGYKSGIFA